MSVIYRITVEPTGAVYIGSADSAHSRWGQHRSYLRRGKHHNSALQSAFTAHGEAALRFEVVEELPIGTRQSAILDREAAHIRAALASGDELLNVESVPGARRRNGWAIHDWRLLSQEPRPKGE